MTFMIPGGKEKGVPLAQAQMESLTYWAQRIGDTLNKGESRYADRDKKLLSALHAEIVLRESGGAQQPVKAAAPSSSGRSQLATRSVDELAGSYSKPSEVAGMLRDAAQVAHLVTPQTSCGEVPPGCSIAASAVLIDVDRETYELPGGKRGLDKTALARISAAAGVDWDPTLSGRLDNGRDPYYVHFRAVGRVRGFDGTVRTEIGEVEIDLRDGAPDALDAYKAAELKDEAAAKSGNAKDKARRTPTGVPLDLAGARKFILRHAESKAQNRVIRRLGVRTSYTRAELAKPFVVAKIMFTGQTDDPALRRMFAEKTADAFLGARASLYGGQRHATPALPSSTPRHDPPPVGEAAEDDFSDYDDEPASLPETTGAQVVSAESVPRDAVAASTAAGQQG